MKIKLYILHSDTPQEGITLRVFTSNAKRQAHMKAIMLADIQTATESAAIRDIRRLLKKKNIGVVVDWNEQTNRVSQRSLEFARRFFTHLKKSERLVAKP